MIVVSASIWRAGRGRIVRTNTHLIWLAKVRGGVVLGELKRANG